MKRFSYFLLSFIGLVLLSSHDMYLKLNNFFLEPSARATVELFNGTFEKSENVIDRDRMVDVSIVQNGSRVRPSEESWYEKDSVTHLDFDTGAPGTYVIGLSTKARTIEMDSDAFNDYLKHDGILDMLAQRESQGTMNEGAVERYSKHVKTIVQVGDKTTDDWKTVLNYPIEFVPLQNPYELQGDQRMSVQLLSNQTPLANQLVYLGYKPQSTTHTHDGSTHSHESEESHEHNDLIQLRTDEKGTLKLPIDKDGIWYLRTIHLVELENSAFTHESNWATLTFAVGDDNSHEHTEEDHTEGLPFYYFILGSLVLIAVFFLFFRKKNNES